MVELQACLRKKGDAMETYMNFVSFMAAITEGRR